MRFVATPDPRHRGGVMLRMLGRAHVSLIHSLSSLHPDDLANGFIPRACVPTFSTSVPVRRGAATARVLHAPPRDGAGHQGPATSLIVLSPCSPHATNTVANAHHLARRLI